MAKLTLTAVSALCNRMVLAGEKPTVRKVQEQLGVSFNRIIEYLNQWRTERDLANESSTSISQELTNALLAEFAKIGKKVASTFSERLEEQNAELHEAKEELEKLSQKISLLEQDNQNLKKSIELQYLKYEKKAASDESMIQFLKDEKESLHQAIKEANHLKH